MLTNPSTSIAPYPIGLISISLLIIFGVVPEPISVWNPDIAPHAMVIITYGQTGPGMIGPPPWMNFVVAGMMRLGWTNTIPIASSATVPSFM